MRILALAVLALCLAGCRSKSAGKQTAGPATYLEQRQENVAQSQAAGVQIAKGAEKIQAAEVGTGATAAVNVTEEKREAESTAGRDLVQHITEFGVNALTAMQSTLYAMVVVIGSVCGMCTTIVGLLAAAYARSSEQSRKREEGRHKETREELKELKRQANGGKHA